MLSWNFFACGAPTGRGERAEGAKKIECFVPINGILKGETRRRRETFLGVFCTYNVIFKVETRRRREIFLGVLSLHIGFQRGNAPKARKILGVFVLINWIFKGENASKARKNWMSISPPSTKSWRYVKKIIIAELFFDPIILAPPYLVSQNGREGGPKWWNSTDV